MVGGIRYDGERRVSSGLSGARVRMTCNKFGKHFIVFCVVSFLLNKHIATDACFASSYIFGTIAIFDEGIVIEGKTPF